MTDYALRYARALKKRPPRKAQEPRTGTGEGGGQGSRVNLAALVARLSPEERVDFEERAGVREYDGGFTRAEAERLAWEDLEKRRGATCLHVNM